MIHLDLFSRYQPDGALERRAGTGERDYLSSEEGESDLTESESHLNMLKGGSSTLQAVLHPPASPSEDSSSVVNVSICVLGRRARAAALSAPRSPLSRVTVSSPRSDHSVRGQLPHHLPRPRPSSYGGVGPDAAHREPPGLQRLHLHGLQTASDEQEGLLHGVYC